MLGVSQKPTRRAKVITTDGPVSLPRQNTGPPPRSSSSDDTDGTDNIDEAQESLDFDRTADAGVRSDGPVDLGIDDNPIDDEAIDDDPIEDDPIEETAFDDGFDHDTGDEFDEAEEIDHDVQQAADGFDEAEAADDLPAESPAIDQQQLVPVPEDVLRLQSDLVQGAVRREQRIAEITAAVAQAISKAHREVNQSAAELDSLRSMLQGVASADESQSFVEIERVQETIEATQAELADLNESRQELASELVTTRSAVQDREAALDQSEADRASLEADRDEAERRAQELFDRLTEATQANSELKSRLDDLVAAEDIATQLEARIRLLTAEKATAIHQATTNEAALQQRLDEAQTSLTEAQRAQAASSESETAMALEKAQATGIKMKAELDMARAELAKTKAELDQAYVAETELETKLQSAWTTADTATAEQQTATSDQQRLVRDLSDANKNLERLRARLDKAAVERQEALDDAEAEHAEALKAAAADQQTALEKQSRDHQAGVAALKAAHKKKLSRLGDDLQQQSDEAAAKLQTKIGELQSEIAAFEKRQKSHADELAKRDTEVDKLGQTHADELAKRDTEVDKLAQTHAAELDKHKAATERVEAQLTKLQTTHDALVDEQKTFEAEREAIKDRAREMTDLKKRLDTADAKAVEREAELEKLRLSNDDTHQRIGTLLGQIETLQASAEAQTAHADELAKHEAELEAEIADLRKQATSAIEARSKVIKGAESTALLASQAETRAEQLDRDMQQAIIERDAVTGALTTAEARIVNLEAELDRITTLADQRVQAAFESATALGERAIADAEAKERRIQELEAQLSMLQHRGSGVS